MTNRQTAGFSTTGSLLFVSSAVSVILLLLPLLLYFPDQCSFSVISTLVSLRVDDTGFAMSSACEQCVLRDFVYFVYFYLFFLCVFFFAVVLVLFSSLSSQSSCKAAVNLQYSQ